MPTLTARLLENARLEPDRPAIRMQLPPGEDILLTGRSLFDGAAGFARALQSAGVAPGETVILVQRQSPELVHAFFGCILQGAIPSIMPFLTEKLSPEEYRRSLAALFEISTPAAVIAHTEYEPEVRRAMKPGGSIRCVVAADGVAPEELADPASLPGLARGEEEIAFLQHSSGTTGLQKGVALSHRAVFRQIESYSAALRLAPGDVVASWLPLYHDMGLIAGFLMPVLARVPLILMSPFDWVRAPVRLLQAVSQHKATLTWLPNFAYNFCAQKIRARDLEGIDLSSWRAVINCSEPVHARSHRMFRDRFQPYGLRPEALATCYAMAENVFAVTQGGIGAPVTEDVISQKDFFGRRLATPMAAGEGAMTMLSCGRPIAGTRVKVLDDARRELPERALGEIALRSDCMLSGYYHRDDLTAQAFHEGWFLTGDIGYTAGGEVYVTGRKKDMIIVGGKNVYPQDLETLTGEVPGVHPGRAVAFGVENEDSGTEDVVIVAESDVDPSDPDEASRRQEIAVEVRRRVNSGSDISVRDVRMVARGWLLKTSSGKIARGANREKYLKESGNEVE